MTPEPAIPLTNWANLELGRLFEVAGIPSPPDLTGATLLGERAALNGFAVPGRVSAGGGCRLYKARGGWVALNLTRADDRDLLPALFSDASLDSENDDAVAACIARSDCAALVARGREIGLAIAADNEPPAGPATTVAVEGRLASARKTPPLVVDLSGLWAGPLAGHLLSMTGARVIKVEGQNRPEAMRAANPAFFALLNQGKDSVTVELRNPDDRQAFTRLLRRADVVIEAARPRALAQLGIDASRMVWETPGLVWVTITGHGGAGEAANWVGFGDDCSLAGGLTAALAATTGRVGFVGDAIADPLTGIMAARIAYERWISGKGGRIFLSMSGVVANALGTERERDPAALDDCLKQWARSLGLPFPPVSRRSAGTVRPLGQDNARWLAGDPVC